MDPAKLKVVELRAELAKRGLDQKGVKAVLVARLQEALEAEENDAGEEDEEEEQDEQEDEDCVQAEKHLPKSEPSGQDETSAQSMQSSEPEVARTEEDSMQFTSYPEESESKFGYEVNEGSVIHPPDSEEGCGKCESVSHTSYEMSDKLKSVIFTDVTNDPDISKQEDTKNSIQNYEESSDCVIEEDDSWKKNVEDQSFDTWNQQGLTHHGEEESERSFQLQESSFHLDDSNAQDALDTQPKSDFEDFKPEAKNITCKVAEDEINTDNVEVKEEILDSTASTKEVQEDAGAGEKQIKSEEEKCSEGKQERKNRWDNARPNEAKKKQRSPSEPRQMSPFSRKPDDEPEFDEKAVLLSWFDSDLHMLINKENFNSATLITHSGFGYVWSGVRATYGFEKGKVCYEVRITENIKVPYLENEPHPNILRVGWSVQSSSLQLGEEPLSYGFGGTGKISSNCQFANYGKPFVINDVVGCYLNLDSNQIEISYTINGEYQGVAYNISHEELKGQPLFPHILSKNCSFEVNFGNREPWAQIMCGYTNVGEVSLENRIPGPRRPEKREDCEVIMMIGLPACGKTTWATKYAAEHKDKMYNILGTNALIDKMKVMGMPRRRNYSGRWDVLISKCTKCLNTLLEIGACRRRNYIIDQTNVYPTAQRRKMRGFEGFVRRAVVIVPSDEEFKARTAKREAEEGKDVPDSAILEMKANFALPEKGEIFNEVIYTELQEEEAKKIVTQYNKEGNDHGYFSHSQQQKRLRMDDSRNDRRDFRNEGSDQRRMENRGRPDSRGGHDGWRDRGFNNRRRGDHRCGWGPPRPGGWRDNRGSWRGGPPNRFNDRGGHGGLRDMRDRSRDFRDRRDGPPGKIPDRRGIGGDRDDKNRPKPMPPQNQQQAWGNQGQGYNQGWSQNYGNQAWGGWNQGYNQQQWKNYTQQPQQQAWGQQGWGNQGWSSAGWNQQYYNQYQQNWAHHQQGMTTDASTGTDSTTMAAAYASYGQTGSWPGYTTAGYTAVGSTVASGAAGTGTGSAGSSSMPSYSSMQKQFRQDPRKAS